ncbi:MAG: T9SS type A sorting domain-containing protein, partial [Bacteroidales bacterium]|nr:T9SS type A sorting domain-containing protein [Bacteroidales bacterium]
TVMMAGLYSVVVTDGNGCEGYAEVTTSYLVVTIPACPASMNVLITDPAFTITGEDPMGGIYSGAGVVGTNVFDPALAGLGGHVITYTIQDICGPQSCEFLITVSDEPITCEDATITNFPTTADDVCEGEAYAIDFTGVIIENAVEEIWTVDPITAGEVTANVFNLNVGYVGDVTITLLAVAEDLCNDASASVGFTVHPLPLIEITGDLEFCEGEETTLTATEGVSYLWSTGEITQSITVSVSGDYSVTVTDENGCEGFTEVTVIVHPLPLVEITGDLEFCEGEETTLTATEGVSYLWSTGEITQSITVSVSGDYSVTVTDENGCEGFAEVTVIVLPAPIPECPGLLEIYVNDPLLLLDMATPLGGAYSGVGVTFDGVDYYFDPSAGAGLYDIDYCYSDPVTGCEGCCQFTIKVLSIPGEGQVICMQTGWSIISSYFQPDNPQLDDIFAGLNAENKVTIMLGQNGIYWPGQNINTLGSWNVFNGYKIKMNQPGCIDITGEMPADKTVSLPSGASFVPMLCDQPIPADEIFDQPGNGLLFAFDLQNQLLYWPQGGIYTLQTLEPGIGYLVNMIQPGQVTFNCAKNSVSGYVKAQPKVYPDAPWSYDMTGSAHLISISSAALGELSKGDYVGVFTDDGVCAGFTQYNEEKGNILLVAYGDDFTTESLDGLTDNETMSFRTYHTASKVEEPTEVTFSDLMTDAGQFTEMGRSMIVKMSAGSTSIVEGKLSSISLHPNPSDGLINLTIPAMNEVLSIEVTNSSGQLVHSETIESKAVSHQLDLTGVNPGVYFVRITGNGQTVVKKVVIQ